MEMRWLWQKAFLLIMISKLSLIPNFLGSLEERVNAQVVAIVPTHDANSVLLRMIFPRPYENKRRLPVSIQLRLEGFRLGNIGRHSKDLAHHPSGQTLRVIVDNGPYIVYHRTMEGVHDPEALLDQIIALSIPFRLTRGEHVIRAFPAYASGESVKGQGCFIARAFYFQDPKKASLRYVNLSVPYLTYNEPQGKYQADHPILLDFYLSHCFLSPEGYKVHLVIKGYIDEILTRWTPYYLYGLPKGHHVVKLELLDSNNQVVPGHFNLVEREIIIE